MEHLKNHPDVIKILNPESIKPGDYIFFKDVFLIGDFKTPRIAICQNQKAIVFLTRTCIVQAIIRQVSGKYMCLGFEIRRPSNQPQHRPFLSFRIADLHLHQGQDISIHEILDTTELQTKFESELVNIQKRVQEKDLDTKNTYNRLFQ